MVLKTLIPLIIMALVVVGLKLVIPYVDRKAYLVGYIAVISIIGAIVYLLISYKMGILESAFGKDYINRIMKKLTVGKLQIK